MPRKWNKTKLVEVEDDYFSGRIIDTLLDLWWRKYKNLEFLNAQINSLVSLQNSVIENLVLENSFFLEWIDLLNVQIKQLSFSLVVLPTSWYKLPQLKVIMSILEDILKLRENGNIKNLQINISWHISIPKGYFKGRIIDTLNTSLSSTLTSALDFSNSTISELFLTIEGTPESPIHEGDFNPSGLFPLYKSGASIGKIHLAFQWTLELPKDYFNWFEFESLCLSPSLNSPQYFFELSNINVSTLKLVFLWTKEFPIKIEHLWLIQGISMNPSIKYEKIDILFQWVIECPIEFGSFNPSKYGIIQFENVYTDFSIILDSRSNFENILIDDSNFWGGFDAYGAKIQFFQAETSIFSSYLSFAKAKLEKVLINKCTVNGEIVFHETEIQNLISLAESVIDKCLFMEMVPVPVDGLIIVDFQYGKFWFIDFTPKEYRSIELWIINTQFETFIVSDDIWDIKLRFNNKMSEIEKLKTYQRIRSREPDFFKKYEEEALKDSGKISRINIGQAVSELEQLSWICLKNDMKAASDKFYYEMLKNKTKRKSILPKIWDTLILNWMFGWWIKLWRVVFSIFLIVSLFVGILSLPLISNINMIYKVKDERCEMVECQTIEKVWKLWSVLSNPKDKFLLSFQSFLGGFLFSDYGVTKEGDQQLLVLLLKIEGMLGIFFIAIFTALLANKFERK